jgi:hypothetical protein
VGFGFIGVLKLMVRLVLIVTVEDVCESVIVFLLVWFVNVTVWLVAFTVSAWNVELDLLVDVDDCLRTDDYCYDCECE